VVLIVEVAFIFAYANRILYAFIMAVRDPIDQNDLTGKRVLILVEPYAGQEGICLGKSADGIRWAVSPDSSNEILQLLFEKEFGILIDSLPNKSKLSS